MDRVQASLQKGVEYFYIHRNDQLVYLQYCRQISKALLGSSLFPTEIKTSQILNCGQETISFLRQQGISEQSLQFAHSFLESVVVLIKDMNFHKTRVIEQFLLDVHAYEHGVATTLIASLISYESGIQSSSLVQIVGMAGLFHDIGLSGLSQELIDEDDSKISQEELEIFHTHPQRGAETLQKVPGIHSTVIQAVLQHHQRRGKMGFYSENKSRSLNRVAEIIGISDDYLRISKRISKEGGNLEQAFEREAFAGFSASIVDIFRSVFFKR